MRGAVCEHLPVDYLLGQGLVSEVTLGAIVAVIVSMTLGAISRLR
jgi:hypothetical protein